MPEIPNLFSKPWIWAIAFIFVLVSGYLVYRTISFDDDYVASAPGPVAQQNISNAEQGLVQRGPSGLPLPRYASLKSDRVNVRVGPSQNNTISWVFRRQGLPVEIIAEFENWRQIRDGDGSEGWVIQSLLSGRRTVLVAPWLEDKDETFPLRQSADENSQVMAQLEQNILASLAQCQSGWCRIDVQGVNGWLPQNLLWGVAPNETFN